MSLQGCEDTPGWTNGDRPGGALRCADYVSQGHCASGQLLTAWAGGSGFNHPQKHCCACGKWDREAAFWRAEQSKEHEPQEAVPCWDERLDDPQIPWGGSSFCAEWPRQPAPPALDPAAQRLVREAARRAVAPFGRIEQRALRAAVHPRCAQKLCMRVQLLSGSLYVVAPESSECPPGPSTSPCSTEARERTPGIPSGWWPPWNPTRLQWHFFAGLNVSDCSGLVRPGDYNGPCTRLRLLNALRLLEEAARHAPDLSTELVLCVSEVPVNAGGWCLKGPQPVFSSTGCAGKGARTPQTTSRFAPSRLLTRSAAARVWRAATRSTPSSRSCTGCRGCAIGTSRSGTTCARRSARRRHAGSARAARRHAPPPSSVVASTA